MLDKKHLVRLGLDTPARVYYMPAGGFDGQLHGTPFKSADLRDLPKIYDELDATVTVISSWLWIEGLGKIDDGSEMMETLRIVTDRIEGRDPIRE